MRSDKLCVPETVTPTRRNAVNSWIVLDGMNWDGISVYGYNDDGVEICRGFSNVMLCHLESMKNGAIVQRGGEMVVQITVNMVHAGAI